MHAHQSPPSVVAVARRILARRRGDSAQIGEVPIWNVGQWLVPAQIGSSPISPTLSNGNVEVSRWRAMG
ncbi:MAG: hypothetical protein H0T45_15325 [Pyrinomonadaceae bacterium]|nr:hypothetical protein [Pyrinomonadaceae bacterium]